MSSGGRRVTALILAGSRGPDDPVARQAGVTHKALALVAGVPMLSRVLSALKAAPSVARIALCIDRAAAPGDIGPDILLIEPGATPGASVALALERLADPLPLLVTTADHALLTPDMIEHLCARAPSDADACVGLASATTIRRAYPETQRTYYRFAGEGYSGCNLFLLQTPQARRIVAFWSEMERHRKRPWRLVAAVGPLTLLRFLMGMLSLDDALRRLSQAAGAKVRAVDMPFAEAAIDVDKPADLELAERILERRAG